MAAVVGALVDVRPWASAGRGVFGTPPVVAAAATCVRSRSIADGGDFRRYNFPRCGGRQSDRRACVGAGAAASGVPLTATASTGGGFFLAYRLKGPREHQERQWWRRLLLQFSQQDTDLLCSGGYMFDVIWQQAETRSRQNVLASNPYQLVATCGG